MSDTPIPSNPSEQPEETAQPEAENVVAFGGDPAPDVTEADPGQPEPKAQEPSLEDRMQKLGAAGAVLKDVLETLIGALEGVGNPKLVAGSVGFLMDISEDPNRIEYGCIASLFGNDLLIKGLMATMAEQQATKNAENQRRAMRQPQGGAVLESLLSALKQTAAAKCPTESMVPGDLIESLCGDPTCDPCVAAREFAGIPPLPAAGPIAGPDAGPDAAEGLEPPSEN